MLSKQHVRVKIGYEATAGYKSNTSTPIVEEIEVISANIISLISHIISITIGQISVERNYIEILDTSVIMMSVCFETLL